ncbi:MAG: cell division protein FtsA [Sedimentibacter sp.]
MDDLIFALDIGTRSVVGVVCENLNGILKVREIKSYFHNQRSMIDGQIEDIKEVSRVVGIVKDELEKSLNIVLDKVSIAAAGRALKTERILLEKDNDSRVPVSHDFIKAMETEALHLAQDLFAKSSSGTDLFYCVGYSVLCYKLDNRTMSKLEGHRGNKVSVEIIAAFLPHTVIEGLYTCMDNNNLGVNNLTLEPIAAMDLIIPPELRLLNLALIDIGAGTSDIAISKNGSIVGYDMATIAGDEITECLMKNYIVDFNTAEEIKAALSDDKDMVTITNILGISQDINKQEILESLRATVYDLCADVSAKIIKMNKESPAAVFLAGGGSKTPFIREILSEFLNIPQARIALTDKKSLKSIDLSAINSYGPELITPLGIAYSVVLNKNYDFFSVTVNEMKVRLYGIRQMKVMDAILMSGFDTKKLIGLSGKSLRFTINGNQHYYAGQFSTPSQIYVNSKIANIETIIRPGDKIEVIPAKNGETPIVKISDIVHNNKGGFVYFNGMKTDISTKYFVNSTEVTDDFIIGNSDVIEVEQIQTIKDLYKLYKMDESIYQSYINSSMVDLDYQLFDGLKIDVLKIDNIEKLAAMTVINENEEKTEVISDKKEEEQEPFIKVTLNNKIVNLPLREDNMPYIFADMLNYTDIDPSDPKGDIVLLHNGKNASYLNFISANDVIVIKWDSE